MPPPPGQHYRWAPWRTKRGAAFLSWWPRPDGARKATHPQTQREGPPSLRFPRRSARIEQRAAAGAAGTLGRGSSRLGIQTSMKGIWRRPLVGWTRAFAAKAALSCGRPGRPRPGRVRARAQTTAALVANRTAHAPSGREGGATPCGMARLGAAPTHPHPHTFSFSFSLGHQQGKRLLQLF